MLQTSSARVRRACGARLWHLVLGGALLALPVARANAANTNLTATGTYSASSSWEQDLMPPNSTFTADKAFDGDLGTRWNSFGTDGMGAWLAVNWMQPQTINKVVILEAFDRITTFNIQTWDVTKMDWVDAYVANDPTTYDAIKQVDAGGNATFSVRFNPPLVTTGIRMLNNTPGMGSISIFEVQAWNNPSGQLTGKVSDASGNPAAGVTVADGSDASTTDASGNYKLTADVGTGDVTFYKTGVYKRKTIHNVAVTSGGTTPLNANLSVLPLNLALAATASSSSDYQKGTAYNAAKANDGNPATRWNSDGGDVNGAWLELDWKTPQTFDRVTILEAIDRIRDYSLMRWDSTMNNWVQILDNMVPATGAANPTFTHVLQPPVTTTKLQLLVNQADNLPSIWELQVFDSPFGALNGMVTDSVSGKPVPNATVTSDDGVVNATADMNGAFSVPVIDAGDYVLSATAPGYLPVITTPATVKPNGMQSVTVPTLSGGTDLALSGMAQDSSDDTTHVASNVNDGDPTTFWQSDPMMTTNQWVGVVWPKAVTFNVIQLNGFHSTIENTVCQSLAADGKTWMDIPGTTLNIEKAATAGNTVPTYYLTQPVSTTGLRFFVSATNSATGNPGLSELIAYNAALPTMGGTPGTVCGDLLGKNNVTVGDATVALRIAVGLVMANATNTAGACAHTINVAFATQILRAAVFGGTIPPM